MRHYLLLSALCLGATTLCHADTITDFSFTNTSFASGATAAGTLQIDTTTGVFESIDATYTLGSTIIDFTGAPTRQSSFNNGSEYYEYSLDSQTNPQNALLIDLPVSSLMGYTGGKLCSLSAPCGSNTSFLNNVSGSVDRVAAGSLAITPEPSSFVLLGTGLLGTCGFVKRRFFQ